MSASPGPGSQLQSLLSGPFPDEVQRLLRWMDRIGPKKCKRHISHIVGKVQQSGRECAASLVDLAIQSAERGEPLPVTPAPPRRDKPRDPCVYLGAEIDKPDLVGKKLWSCQLFGECMRSGGQPQFASCDNCKSKLTLGRPDFAKVWQDPLSIHDRRGKPTHALRGILAGRSVFLAGGGPSANGLNLELLERRGAWTLCVNNMAGHSRFRPQAFVCTDPPEKFSDSVWLDPQIMKFIPDPKLVDPGRGKLRTKLPDGTFAPLQYEGRQMTTQDCPNVWGVKRREWLACDETFFLDDAAPNGQYKRGVDKTGEPRTICTLLFAMRILRYLGAREVFLIGVDFHMDPTRPLDGNYSFGEGRTPEACASNNNQFRIVNDWLCRLQHAKVFARFNLSCYNCNPKSGLRAFPYVPFETAIERVCAGVEAAPRLSGWYEKKDKRRK